MRRTGQTDGANITDIDDILVAKTGRSEINLILRGYSEDLSN